MRIGILCWGLLFTSAGCARGECPAGALVVEAPRPTLSITAKHPLRESTQRLRLGVNLEWVGFQGSFWDENAGAVRADLVQLLKPFPGLIYRYPGGTVANHFDWPASTGPVDRRAPQKAVDWRSPLPSLFGPEEYRALLEEVDGVGWIVLNLWGSFRERQPAPLLLDGARAAVLALNGAEVLRWELGNELDRGAYQLAPEDYARISLLMADRIRTLMPAAQLVGLMRDHDVHPKFPAKRYNEEVAEALSPAVQEFALHSYFDGKPGGPPIPNRVKHVCESAQQARRRDGVAGVWITEFGRWPPGRVTDRGWKQQWPKSSNLGAALGVVDYLLAVSQIPAVRGAILHSLSSAEGPWQFVHQDRRSGELYPSAVYSALRLVYPFFSWKTLESRTAAPNLSGYGGGYDVRAVAFADPAASDRYAIVAVNRGPETTLSVRNLDLPGVAGKGTEVEMTWLTAPGFEDGNDDERKRRVALRRAAFRATGDVAGETSLPLGAQSVAVYQFRTNALTGR